MSEDDINPELLEPDCTEKAKKKYFGGEKGRAALKKYSETEKGKAVRKKYCSSEKFKLAERKYYYSEKGQASFKKVYEKRKLFREAQKWLQENPDKTFDDFLKEKGLLDNNGNGQNPENTESNTDSRTETGPEISA